MQTEVVERHRAFDFQAVLTQFQARLSYRALTSEELTRGMAAMQEEWQRYDGRVVDPGLHCSWWDRSEGDE
jgi:hypothetical protein